MAMTRSEISRRYNETHTKRIPISLNLKTDADIIKWLEEKDEKNQTYIKRLIKEDMEKNG